MNHPLYASRNGALLYSEVPPVHRQHDLARDQLNESGNPTGRKVRDLEAFLHGFGHLLDRFDATLAQFYADGFLSDVTVGGEPAAIQGWLLPYVAELFGVELVAPDANSRRRELRSSIWIAHRRGTRVAIDRAAEAMVNSPVVVVDGAARVLRAASTAYPPMTCLEIMRKWHPADQLILRGRPADVTQAMVLKGFRATRPAAHPGLPVGVPIANRRMRARLASVERPDIDMRPISGSGNVFDLAAFVVADRKGVPCFPGSYEDRSLRTPDMRRPRPNRIRTPFLPGPDAITLFVRPPDGFITREVTATVVNALPQLASAAPGGIAVPDLQSGKSLEQMLFRSASTLDLDPVDDADDKHVINGLRFDGTVRLQADARVELVNCAIRRLTFAPGFTGSLLAKNCVFESMDFVPDPQGKADRIELIYVTVTGAARLPTVKASDCLFSDLTIAGVNSGNKVGCIRYSRVQAGFDATHIQLMRSTRGPVTFLPRPCLPPNPPVAPPAPQKVTRAPVFAEEGYAVLSDINPPSVVNGAQDGGELGAYHDQHHLARLAAAARKASLQAPAGRKIFALYDVRLLANLPN